MIEQLFIVIYNKKQWALLIEILETLIICSVK